MLPLGNECSPRVMCDHLNIEVAPQGVGQAGRIGGCGGDGNRGVVGMGRVGMGVVEIGERDGYGVWYGE